MTTVSFPVKWTKADGTAFTIYQIKATGQRLIKLVGESEKAVNLRTVCGGINSHDVAQWAGTQLPNAMTLLLDAGGDDVKGAAKPDRIQLTAAQAAYDSLTEELCKPRPPVRKTVTAEPVKRVAHVAFHSGAATAKKRSEALAAKQKATALRQKATAMRAQAMAMPPLAKTIEKAEPGRGKRYEKDRRYREKKRLMKLGLWREEEEDWEPIPPPPKLTPMERLIEQRTRDLFAGALLPRDDLHSNLDEEYGAYSQPPEPGPSSAALVKTCEAPQWYVSHAGVFVTK